MVSTLAPFKKRCKGTVFYINIQTFFQNQKLSVIDTQKILKTAIGAHPDGMCPYVISW